MPDKAVKAVVFNIMRYCIHDGPGIRTTVFFKGCPLSCKWCHNPEGIDPKPFHLPEEDIGYELSADELMDEIKKDRIFYEQSGGGVTFSGGEPFLQGDFLLEILSMCKDEYIKTAIDTSGYCGTDLMIKAAETADCFLFDIKFFDSGKHIEYCGAPNKRILDNLICLSETGARLLIRIPVIPSINDDIAEMTAIFGFIKDLNNIEMVHLLPYHNIHSRKYAKIGMQYELEGIPAGVSPNMDAIKSIFERRFRTKIGG